MMKHQIIVLFLFLFLHSNLKTNAKEEEDILYNNEPLIDEVEDSLYDPFQYDYSCEDGDDVSGLASSCNGWELPESTIEELKVESSTCLNSNMAEHDDYFFSKPSIDTFEIDVDSSRVVLGSKEKVDLNDLAAAAYGGSDPDNEVCELELKTVDKHWGGDAAVLRLRDKLRQTGLPKDNAKPWNQKSFKRPPIFLIPGLASTRLVNWSHVDCPGLVSDIRMLEPFWVNIAKMIEVATIDHKCWAECLSLGLGQTDRTCKLRPHEGLEAISSLAPGGANAVNNLLMGSTNTVYAWLVHWIADNLGYDVGSMIGLPYDWRLSPDKMEQRDGYLTLMRKKIEASVQLNGLPGIVVAHSMGNLVLRYFLEWLRDQMHQEAYHRFLEAQNNLSAVSVVGANTKKLPGWMKDARMNVDKFIQDKILKGRFKPNNRDYESYVNRVWNDLVKKLEKAEDEKDIDRSGILWELSVMEGDAAYIDWVDKHIYTYVGLGAPLLGAAGPVRSVLSGENMGLPITHEVARDIEVSFGSTNTANPISSRMGFCDRGRNITNIEVMLDGVPRSIDVRSDLACMEDIVHDIEAAGGEEAWNDHPVLKLLLKDRVDADVDFPLFQLVEEFCVKGEKPPCANHTITNMGPLDVQSGDILRHFNRVFKEKDEPLQVKLDQLEDSWWHTPFPNLLNTTWDRPHIKHVIMAYGVDYPTEVGYIYKKTHTPEDDLEKKTKKKKTSSNNETDYDGVPHLETVIWEEAEGRLMVQSNLNLKERLLKRKPKKQLYNGDGKGTMPRGGDGSIPYVSLAWAHTWLLHASRALRKSASGEWVNDNIQYKNALKAIKISHRPEGGTEWIQGVLKEDVNTKENKEGKIDKDTGTAHPHGTKYKPLMQRYKSKGRSRTNGMEYTTTVIEAIGIEHKEATRNYDILAAVFTDVLKNLHKDDIV